MTKTREIYDLNRLGMAAWLESWDRAGKLYIVGEKLRPKEYLESERAKRKWYSSANGQREREKDKRRDTVAPLIEAIKAMGPASKNGILNQAYDALTQSDYFDWDEPAYEIVLQVQAANTLPESFSRETFIDWFRDIPADEF